MRIILSNGPSLHVKVKAFSFCPVVPLSDLKPPWFPCLSPLFLVVSFVFCLLFVVCRGLFFLVSVSICPKKETDSVVNAYKPLKWNRIQVYISLRVCELVTWKQMVPFSQFYSRKNTFHIYSLYELIKEISMKLIVPLSWVTDDSKARSGWGMETYIYIAAIQIQCMCFMSWLMHAYKET